MKTLKIEGQLSFFRGIHSGVDQQYESIIKSEEVMVFALRQFGFRIDRLTYKAMDDQASHVVPVFQFEVLILSHDESDAPLSAFEDFLDIYNLKFEGTINVEDKASFTEPR